MKGLRILVTGGLGYAGGWISSFLARAGHEVFVTSRRTEQPDLGAPYTLVPMDVATPDMPLPPGLDVVVHAASLNEAHLPDYPRQALLVNALGARNLLAALAEASASAAPPLFIYCSTFHVYGKSEGRIGEDSPVAPVGDYALTHFFAEEYCRSAMRLTGQPCIILRLTNGYGAPKTPVDSKWHLLVNDLCRQAVTQGAITLRSSPALMRDFVWLGDMAKTVAALLERRDLAGRLFNVASGSSLAIGDVARRIATVAEGLLGRAVPLRCEQPGGKAGALLQVDNRALQKALGLSFEDRLEQEAAAVMRLLLP
ncbi:SDR family oxidoreductase [Desulfovibrio sp. OttesenSCG-928-M14]|nr:SDR family oxidoreductase [Desulfovibrio sp. OttesenSCG-928-M14]